MTLCFTIMICNPMQVWIQAASICKKQICGYSTEIRKVFLRPSRVKYIIRVDTVDIMERDHTKQATYVSLTSEPSWTPIRHPPPPDPYPLGPYLRP